MKVNNVKLIKKDACCGCTACYSVCPKNAITMECDEEGFLYPKIDENKCVNCGLCLKVCRDKMKYLTDINKVKVYAAKNRDECVLKKSSSGGISNALGKKIIDVGGIVYGVIYDENHRVIVKRSETKKDLDRLYGSKYVQADLQNTFKEVHDDLRNNKVVLFIATSCYVAGLKSFLINKKCNIDNLYTVDLVCHGVPSPKIFSDYINYLREKYDFDHFEFRTKELPWGYGSKNYGCTIFLKNNKKIVDSTDARLFLNIFFSNYCLRPCCYKCAFSKIEKPADMTIADYWGVANEHPDFFDEKGVSAVIIHTDKGEKLFNDTKDIIAIKSSINKVKNKQPNLDKPSGIKNDRDLFWKTYEDMGFKYVCKKYFGLNFKTLLKSNIKKVLVKIKIIRG